MWFKSTNYRKTKDQESEEEEEEKKLLAFKTVSYATAKHQHIRHVLIRGKFLINLQKVRKCFIAKDSNKEKECKAQGEENQRKIKYIISSTCYLILWLP